MNRAESIIDLVQVATNPVQCEKEASLLRRSIALETIQKRGWQGVKQYGRYFASFWVYGLVEPDRASVLQSTYFWLRHIDDVADQDKPVPSMYESRHQFLTAKRDMVESYFSGTAAPVYGERPDILLVSADLTTQKLGFSLRQETSAVLDTIIFDEERSRSKRVPAQQELDDYFNKLDFACLNGALKIAGEQHCRDTDLPDLSWATRIVFNLRDFPKDFAAGIVNISREDMQKYGVDTNVLAECKTIEELVAYSPMRRWYSDQLTAAQHFLDVGRVGLAGLGLKWITRLAIQVSFINPDQKYLNGFRDLLGNNYA